MKKPCKTIYPNMFKFGDSVITHDNKIGIITQVIEVMQQYFVSFPNGGMLYNFDEVKEWHGVW